MFENKICKVNFAAAREKSETVEIKPLEEDEENEKARVHYVGVKVAKSFDWKKNEKQGFVCYDEVNP